MQITEKEIGRGIFLLSASPKFSQPSQPVAALFVRIGAYLTALALASGLSFTHTRGIHPQFSPRSHQNLQIQKVLLPWPGAQAQATAPGCKK